MRVYDVIEAKKNKRVLTEKEIRFFIGKVADASATDGQIAAFCMAVLLNGMTDEECFYLTDAMVKSGQVASRPATDKIFADKHSTGGVSDSTTLILVPVLASLGICCAKYSGRGLGHTGGTLDKLESFKGFRTDLTAEEFSRQVEKIGAAVSGQTQETVPADKRMYAVRDVTATIDSIPLIASSVMSKKLASFADILLLDVKYGDGAFMKTGRDADKLARLMVSIGTAAGRKTAAAITCMDYPLGDCIGCNAEVAEAIRVLKGEKQNALSKVSFAHCAKILEMAKGINKEESERLVIQSISSGAALKKFEEIICAQGGDASPLYDASLLPMAENIFEVTAQKDGYLTVSALSLGSACAMLGGGRQREGDDIDHTVGIVLDKRQGDFVRQGERLATVFYNRKSEDAFKLVRKAFTFSEKKVKNRPLIRGFVEGGERSI